MTTAEFDARYGMLWDLKDVVLRDATIRRLCLEDLYFFCKWVLGYHWLVYPFHALLCRWVQMSGDMSLFLFPRGSCKTLVFTVGDSIRRYLIHPTEPIAIVCDALKRSEKKLRAIRSHLEGNNRLRSLFPDLVWKNTGKEAPKWTDQELILPGHTGRQEPSFMATSLENQPTGLHFPVNKCDDVVTPETTTTREMMEKNRELYGLYRSSIVQSPGGMIQVAGTIYHDGDLHCDMMREGGGYMVYRRPACFRAGGGYEACQPDEDGATALWPEAFPLSRLLEIRNDPTVGQGIFACQYLLDPAPRDENAYFRMEWFGRYRALPEYVNTYVGCDFALSSRQSADWTVFLVAAVDESNRLYVADVVRGKWDTAQIIDQMLALQVRWRPLVWSCQSDLIKKAIGPFLRKKMRERNVYLNIDDSMPMRDKVANARSIQGRSREGQVMLPESAPWLPAFEDELRRFPKGRHDDIVDAFAFIGMQLDKQVGGVAPMERKRKSLAAWAIDALTQETERDDFEDFALREAAMQDAWMRDQGNEDGWGLVHDMA